MVKYIYIPQNGFWIRRRIPRTAAILLSCLVILLSLAMTLGILKGLLLSRGEAAPQSRANTGDSVSNRFEMLVTNQLSDALDGIYAIEKVYRLSDQNPVAPAPTQTAFGKTTDPVVLETLLDAAQELLEGQTLYFDPHGSFVPGSTVRYYLDETILAITWKEVHEECVYTFSEVKIAHPSQFRRFLAGNEYGSSQQYLTSEMAQSVNAVVAASGDFYGYRNYGAIVYGGQLYRSVNAQLDLCFIDENGDMKVMYGHSVPDEQGLQDYIQENHIRFSLAFGPILVDDYQRNAPAWYPIGEIDKYYSRAALCQMGNLHYLLATANAEPDYPRNPSVYSFGRQIQKTGCSVAYTLDGGQTATIVMNGTLANQVSYGSERRISDIIYFATAVPNGG